MPHLSPIPLVGMAQQGKTGDVSQLEGVVLNLHIIVQWSRRLRGNAVVVGLPV